jgi:hypothetical protein
MAYWRFQRVLEQFEQELNQLDESESVVALRSACKDMSTLAQWRNQRIHARVRISDQRFTLYDWRTNDSLSLTQEEIDGKIQLVVQISSELRARVSHIADAAALEWDQELERLLGTSA